MVALAQKSGDMISEYAGVTFFGLAFLMALSPGPNFFYLASHSMCQGRAAGFASLAGVCFGMFVYMLAAVVGLSSLFVAVPIAYEVLRIAGAVYLGWLAYRAYTRPLSSFTSDSPSKDSRILLFRRGLITCLLNPKIVITYGAFLPLFIDPALGAVQSQLIILGIIQIAAAATAHSLVILISSGMVSVLGRTHTFEIMQRFILGTVLSGLSIRLLFEQQKAS